MEEDTEYKKLPVDERCVHKLWKARVDGYEEAAKLFRQIDDEKSPEWSKYLGLVKKFVIDSNALAQEKGLEATLIFVENCGHAGKTVGEVISGIVAKCIAAPKAKTKDLAVQIALMYIEIEKHENVVEELMKGLEHKNPKIVASCVTTITLALKEFGIKVINIKPIVKKIPVLLSDRDKNVRDETKLLCVEIHRWIGAALKQQLNSLPPILQAELETEFEKVHDKGIPIRYLRSQQEKQAAIAAVSVQSDNVDQAEVGETDQEEIDPMDLIDPVDILSKIPKDYYEKLESKKWQERKESLEALETLLQNPKLETGDYGDIVRSLKKVLTKDSNVVLVALSGKCMANLAKGLGKKFSPYALACVSGILEKFKEKKPNVVSALRDAIDAIYPSTNLEAIQEDVLEALNNKNPSVKFETASFLARSFTKTQPTVLNKKLLKVYITALLKTLNESDPGVRDASAEAIGTAKKLVGEKTITPFLADVDALKLVKINECCEKAVIVVKIPNVKKERPSTAPVRVPAAAITTKASQAEAARPVTRPATASGSKKVVIKKSTTNSGGGSGYSGGLAKSASSAKALPTERALSQEEVDEQAAEILPPDVLQGFADANWNTRMAAVETFLSVVNELPAECGHSQVLIKTLVKKTLKEKHVQVIKKILEVIKVIIEKMGATVTTTDYIINDIVDKFTDAKCNAYAGQVLTAIADCIQVDYVISKCMEYAFEQKSPTKQQEVLNWVNSALREFGYRENTNLITDIKKALQSTTPGVRTAAITLIGTIHLYSPNGLLSRFDGEKPALKQQIQAECDKNKDQPKPQPNRGMNTSDSRSSLNDDDDGGNSEQQIINVIDSLPRVDISGHITESFISEMADKNWKTRYEALMKLQSILNDAKVIKPTLGDLPLPLSQRLADSNQKITQSTLGILEQLAVAMGPSCKQHVRTFLPGMLNALGDNKAVVRQSSISCINAWSEQGGFKEFFECEMIADSLKSGSPALRIELWGWLAEKLPKIPLKSISKDELHACLPTLYANILDRNAEVRKNSNEAVLGYMIHLGFEGMVKALDKQKPATKKDIQAALDKARPNLPIKPLPKNKQQAPVQVEERSVKGGGGAVNKLRPSSSNTKNHGASNNNSAGNAATRKKAEEEVDTSPILVVNSMKHQRVIDEQKLRVLKWTFTTPREEFNELLREQMATANVNKNLMANMFHDDFRYHLKVIDSLNEDLESNSKALVSNLDLILKWLSLRFYDTNPSVLLKSLDYIYIVFVMLQQMEVNLSDHEGSIFLPHLLLKIGDPKDAVRNGVRKIIRQVCLIHPISKIFTHLMEGLKSKNARQRTECLEELGHLISEYNLSVVVPTPQSALKEIARHISDRDNSVRNAALNCIVQAYFLTGEKIYKLIGQISEKDLSMLDERIKRAKRPTKKAEEEKQVTPSKMDQNIISPHDTSVDINDVEPEDSEMVEEMLPQIPNSYEAPKQQVPIVEQTRINGIPRPTPNRPFGILVEVVNEIEKDWIKADSLKYDPLIETDVTFSFAPLKVTTPYGIPYPQEKFEKLLMRNANIIVPNTHTHLNFNMSPQQLNTAQQTQHKTQFSQNVTEAQLDPHLLKIMNNIGSEDSLIARAAINDVNDILESPEKQSALRNYEEIYIKNVVQQFKILSQQPVSISIVLYQPLLVCVLTFFNTKTLGKNLSISSLMNLMSVLLGMMADHKLSTCDDNQCTKVINAICLKVLDRTNFTNLNCALIRLLKETCMSTGLPKFTDLLMKCIWRNVKVMPERSNELNFSDVLYEVHEFMLALPSSWWQQRPSDTPLRTVKTIIHNMAKIKGNSILQDLNKIPSYSELHAYLLRVLKNLQKDLPNSNASPQRVSLQSKDPTKRMSKYALDLIAHIFKLISDKETSNEGLQQLYQFKLDNPEVDFESFLKDASPDFQKYIEKSLKEIEKSRKYGSSDNPGRSGDTKEDHNAENKVLASSNAKDAEYYMEKLLKWKQEGKIPTAGINNAEMMDNKVADENLNLNQLQQNFTPKTSYLKRAELHNTTGLSPNRRELLAQKLSQLKLQNEN